MTNSKHTKRALCASVLSVVLCAAMLLGSTWAWFTDTVTSGGNQIVAGNLKADLIHVGGGEEGADVSIKENPDHLIFDYDKWEPNYTVMETLKVVNKGNLAFKFRLDAVASGATAGPNGEKLADAIDVWVYEGEGIPTTNSFAEMTGDANWRNAGSLSKLMADPDGIARGVLLPAGETPKHDEPVGSVQMTVALHMKETAGNEYQGLTLGSLNFTLNATQYTYEDDAFDDQYDKDAYLPTVVMKTKADLEEYGNGSPKQKRIVFEAPATNNDPTTAVVTGSIDTGVDSGTVSMSSTGVPAIRAVVPDSVETLIFSDMEFNGGILGFGTSRLKDTAQWEEAGILDSVKFVNCTFNGVLYGNLGDLALNVEFDNCKFTNQDISSYSLFISHSTKWKPHNEKQRSLTIQNCNFNSYRGIQITNPDGMNVKFVGNTFDISQYSTYVISLNSEGANSKNLFGDVEIYNNTLVQGKQLVTVYQSKLSMKDGAKVYLYGNELVDGAQEIGGRFGATYEDDCIVNSMKS